jgi:5-dehydro-2-deoxygluconokinase
VTNKTIDVIAMGRVAVDLYAEQLNTPLSHVSSFKKYLGGSPGNISVGCRRLGLRSALISKVGYDAMGDFLLATLKQEQVDTDSVSQTKDNLTALAFLGITPPSTFPLLFYRENCADMQLSVEDLDAGQIAKATYLQLSGTGISTDAMRKTSRKAIELAKASQTKVILDCDFRPILWGLCTADDAQNRYVANSEVSQHYQSFLADCDLIVGTDEELMIAGGKPDVYEAITQIRQLTDAAIVYKKGLEGSEVHLAEGKIIHADTYPVEVLNTLGAGDAFMSGLLYGLVHHESWLQSLSYGNACGAIVSTRHGCAPAMPTKAELLHFIQQYPERGAKVLNDLFVDEASLTRSPLIQAKAGFDLGLTRVVSCQDAYQTGMNFCVLKLNKGEQFTIDDGLETAALLLYGQVNFSWASRQQSVTRRSYFDEAPYVLHTPYSQAIHIDALSACELLIMQTENVNEFEPLLFDQHNLLENEHRGKGLLDDVSYRIVRTVFDKRNRPESNLVVGEIITFQGRWSSCPPHYHPQPEIYHYRFSEPQGFAFAEDGDNALKVYHTDTLVIQNQKTHAHAAAPGYALYTLWFIRHLQNAPYIVPEFVPEHDWCRQNSANQRVWRG